MSVLMVFAGFLFSAVGGYMAGLVGSSNNPISGVTVATVLCSALLLAALAGTGAAAGPASAVLIGAVVACAAAIAGDNMQDLKAGWVLGSTPWKLQVMQITGVLASALVIGPVLNLLNTAYGFGPRTALNPQALPAPQATLMQSVASGVFGGDLPWDIIAAGAGIGAACIAADLALKKYGSSFRAPVLAVAVGLYLPFELDVVIMLGGLVALFADRRKRSTDTGEKTGILAASGFITGEAIMGILLAVPVALSGKPGVAVIQNRRALPHRLTMIALCCTREATQNITPEHPRPFDLIPIFHTIISVPCGALTSTPRSIASRAVRRVRPMLFSWRSCHCWLSRLAHESNRRRFNQRTFRQKALLRPWRY